MKAIIVDMFEKYEPTMLRLSERPYARSYILGLRAKWDQYREPPPQPTVQAVESNQTRSIADEEEAWFHRSDEDDASTSILPVKRKRLQGGKRKPPAKSSGALGLDYDDASDSEGSVEGDSPKSSETTQLVDDLTDVELKIRAKRQRAEQDEGDGALADLVGKTVKKEQQSDTKEKKIRLSLGGLGKKLSKT